MNEELAVPRPVKEPTKEETQARSGLSVSLVHHYSDSAIEQRLVQIEAESKKFKQGRNEASDITATAQRLAKAIMRKPEPEE